MERAQHCLRLTWAKVSDRRERKFYVACTAVVVLLVIVVGEHQNQGFGRKRYDGAHKGVYYAADAAPEAFEEHASFSGGSTALASRTHSFVANMEESPEMSDGEERQLQGDRMILKSGYVNAEVELVSSAMRTGESIVNGKGGYVESSSFSTDWRPGIEAKPTQGTMKIKIPSDRFEECLADFGVQFNVVSQSVSAVDVTSRYVDSKARAQSLQATYDQLIKLMERADQVKDILAVRSQLTSVTAELEARKATVKNLEDRWSMSEITLSLFSYRPRKKKGLGWQPSRAFVKAFNFWKRVAQASVNLLIYAVVVVAPLAAILYIFSLCCVSKSNKNEDTPPTC